MSDYIVAIPARYGSTRFPGKPLALIGGMPMIKRVCLQSLKSRAKKVIACTDDERIRASLEGLSRIEVCMTASSLNCGTDRIAAMIESIGLDDDTVIVNVQGDEPLINPTHIDMVADLLVSSGADMATLAYKIKSVEELFNPNCVKVVLNKRQEALYFSRAPIAYERDNFKQEKIETLLCEHYHHMGIYAYRARLVVEYAHMAQTTLEKAESLEQLRLLENGYKIAVGITNNPPEVGVDTPEDLERINMLIENGKISF